MKYYGICAGPDRRLYCAPCDASTMLVIDPQMRSLSFIEGAGTGGLKYGGICMAPNGVLHCAPYGAASILLLRPFSEDVIWESVTAAGGRNFERLIRESVDQAGT